MLQRFCHYIEQQHLFPPGKEVLLAVSGGRDSVAMLHLCCRAGIPFAVAHCNFHLRPGDCDRDQRFVCDAADALGVPFFTTDFDTRAYAEAHSQSIEEAARELRYSFFADLCRQHGFSAVATAHHRDDSIESFFLNLFRGTGIAGLHGIRPVAEFRIDGFDLRIVRPLLAFSRADIDAYVLDNRLEYVEDVTNASFDARRNQLRHRLMPLLRELYPSVDDTMEANINRLYDTEQIYKEHLATLRASLLTPHRSPVTYLPFEILSLDLPALVQSNPRSSILNTLLFELLRPFGFNAAQCADILAAREGGKLFFSPSHVAELHRDTLLVAPNVEPSPGRHPQPGDRIVTAQSKTRLLSDYLKDLGLSRIERRHLLLTLAPDGKTVVPNF